MPTIDHIVPKALGGRSNTSANKLWCCKACNALKGKKLPLEFAYFMRSSDNPLAETIHKNARILHTYYKLNKEQLYKKGKMKLTEEQIAELAAHLNGSCDSLAEAGRLLFGDEFDEYESFDVGGSTLLYSLVERCAACGWWDDTDVMGEVDGELHCEDCRG